MNIQIRYFGFRIESFGQNAMSHLYLVPSFAVCDSWQKTYTLFCMYTPLFFLPSFLISYVFINIHEYLNEIIRIFYHFDQMAMSQLFFGTKFYKIE